MNKAFFNTLNAGLIVLISILVKQEVKAQLNPMGALYFQNQFLGNPAMAGKGGLNLNMGIRKQWNNIPGSPSAQTLTVDYDLTDKAGIGFNVNNDKSGLLKRTRLVSTYAYHLPVNDNNDKLSFGLSFGLLNERINNEELIGDSDDLSVASYNQRSTFLDGDFGLAYTAGRINIQLTLPNLKSMVNQDDVSGANDRSTFFSAISYKIKTGVTSGLEIEPKAVYRGVNGFNDILDLGANLSYGGNKLNVFGMYHSTKSATVGIGMNYQNLGFGGIYTTSTSALSGYTNGNFELSLRANLLKLTK
jgi:type IX secretion system PorP/SprF family membrane protein